MTTEKILEELDQQNGVAPGKPNNTSRHDGNIYYERWREQLMHSERISTSQVPDELKLIMTIWLEYKRTNDCWKQVHDFYALPLEERELLAGTFPELITAAIDAMWRNVVVSLASFTAQAKGHLSFAYFKKNVIGQKDEHEKALYDDINKLEMLSRSITTVRHKHVAHWEANVVRREQELTVTHEQVEVVLEQLDVTVVALFQYHGITPLDWRTTPPTSEWESLVHWLAIKP